MIIYFCRNVFLQISGKISRIVNIKAWEGTLRAPSMMELPGGNTLCTLHDGATWTQHFVQRTWQTYLEGTLSAPYMMVLPEQDTLCTLHDGATWRGPFVHLTWQTYLKRTLCAHYMMVLLGEDTSCNLHEGPVWKGHFVHPTWRTYLEGTLCATYMRDLPKGDTSCTLHDGLIGGHFMHLTWRTCRGTLRVSYMIMPTRETLRAPYMTMPIRGALRAHDSAYRGILCAPYTLMVVTSGSLFMHQTLLFLIHIKKTLSFLFICWERRRKKF